MVSDKIHKEAHVALLKLCQQRFEILERAQLGMHVEIVCHVVAMVACGGVMWVEPKRVHAQRLDVVQLLANAVQVANAIAV